MKQKIPLAMETGLASYDFSTHIGVRMNLICDMYTARQASGKPVVSFELFPPKTPEGEKALFEKALPEMASLKPDYISVTYGAGGSTQEKTLGIVDQVQNKHHITTLAHLTCVGATREQINGIIQQFKALGVKNILALRGDPPGNVGEFKKTEGGFEYAFELVNLLRQHGDFSVGVAGFPEGHVACKEGRHVDWDRLVNKINCGGDFVLTQLFFDNHDFLAFRDYLTRKGVRVPIVPGIIPILSATQIKRFTAVCGSRLPDKLVTDLDRLGTDDEASLKYGIEYATLQCQELLREGAPGFHFYALNKARSCRAILKNLGLL